MVSESPDHNGTTDADGIFESIPIGLTSTSFGGTFVQRMTRIRAAGFSLNYFYCGFMSTAADVLIQNYEWYWKC